MKRQNIKYVPLAKYISSYKEEKKPGRFLDDLIKIIGAISGASVIFAALFYIFGINYATTFFGAMNIPSQILSLTILEYSAYVWFPIAFIIFLMLILSILNPILDIVLFKQSKRWQEVITRNKKKEKFNVILDSFRQLVYIFIIFCIFGIFYFSLLFTQQLGMIDGKNYLLQKANIIEVHSSSPIALENAQVINSDGYYIYSSFRLLTKNDGKYYLFKELDPETCKPKQVYIIDESKIDQVMISPAEDISDQCNDPVNP